MDGNECCSSSPIARQKLTFIIIIGMLLHDIYANENLNKTLRVESKNIYNPSY